MEKRLERRVKAINFETSVPEDIYLVLLSHGISREALATELRKLLAMRFFQTKILSLGQATRLARLSKWDFIDLLGKNDIPIINYSEEEIEEEFKTVAELEGLGR
jgi:predicted HTH domain antitoxin